MKAAEELAWTLIFSLALPAKLMPPRPASPVLKTCRPDSDRVVAGSNLMVVSVSMPCDGCRNGEKFAAPISMAFQPIVSVAQKRIFAHEALVRGADGGGAAAVFERVDDDTRYAFDQICRTTAISMAAALDLPRDGALLSINFLPNAVYDPRACIRATLNAAEAAGFPLDRIIFEFTETEKVNPDHLLRILRHYRTLGFLTAIDDFGAGYSGTGLLADFVPDLVKLDMNLIRGSESCERRQAILRHTVAMLHDLGVVPVGEGVETRGEYDVLRDVGIDLMQGYYFARPAFEALPDVVWPDDVMDRQRSRCRVRDVGTR